MKEGPDITRIAALIGDPARANMLTALMSGKALTASELAEEAGPANRQFASVEARSGWTGPTAQAGAAQVLFTRQ
jgi:hypothetical protein